MIHFNWPILRAKLKEAIFVLPQFFKNPVQGMRNLPSWDWPTVLVLQGAFAAVCSTLSNILERDIIGVFIGLLIAPLANYLLLAIGTGFFFYTFMFFFKREVPYRQIYLHMLFASIPAQIALIIANLIPPVFLIGAAAMLMLLYVSFVDVFYMDRAKAKRLLIGLMVIYAVFWATQLIRSSAKHERMRLKATPESLDILQKELGVD